MNEIPFHPLTAKVQGQRVKIAKFATDESRGFYYGTASNNGSGEQRVCVRWDDAEIPRHIRTAAFSAFSLLPA